MGQCQAAFAKAGSSLALPFDLLKLAAAKGSWYDSTDKMGWEQKWRFRQQHSKGRDSHAPWCAAGGLWEWPATGTRWKARTSSRLRLRACQQCAFPRLALRAGSPARSAPIPHRSSRWDSEVCCGRRSYGSHSSTSAPPRIALAPLNHNQFLQLKMSSDRH